MHVQIFNNIVAARFDMARGLECFSITINKYMWKEKEQAHRRDGK